MALEESTVSTNTGHVEQATSGMSGAQIDDIERRAKATVTTVKEDAARADAEEHKLAAASTEGASEARVYGDIIAEATGFKTVLAAAELVCDRSADKADISAPAIEGIAKNPRHIESDIALTNRQPGVYRNPQDQRKFGVVDTVSDALGAKPVASARKQSSEDVIASANIAGSSLKDQDKGAIGTWGVSESRMNGVQLAKKLTFDRALSSEHALQSTHVARQQLSASMGMARTMAPGMDLSSGPRFNASQILQSAKEEAELNRWRTQS